MRIFDFGDITVTAEKKNVKNINLAVKRSGVFMSVPQSVSYSEAEDFVRCRLDWIKKQTAKFPPIIEKNYISGETVCVFGKSYTLEVFSSPRSKPAVLGESSLYIYARENSSAEDREKILMKFYKELLETEIPSVIEYWKDIMKVSPQGLRFRDMTSRWGSCNVMTGDICLNVHLAEHPRECAEYVVVHELAHLIVSNHSTRFKAVLDRFLPDWRERKKLLNEGGI